MINAKDVLASVRLTDAETANVQRIEGILSEEIYKATLTGYDGRRVEIRLATPATPKEALAVKRRFQSAGWTVDMAALGEGSDPGYFFAFEPPGVPRPAKVETPPLDVRSAMIQALTASTGVAAGFKLVDRPDLSIIFGSYNRRQNLERAVESIRSSVGAYTYEIVVTDGGSTDGSREWLASQPDVILLGERRLEGAVAAFNHAFSSSRGAFVANFNDDAVYEGDALARGVDYMLRTPEAGQVAFAFKGDGEEWTINEVYPPRDFPSVKHLTTYANFGITRRDVANKVACIQGGFWSPVYRTYCGDNELSAWIWKLGYRVDKLPDARVIDLRTDDALRSKNTANLGREAKRMYYRWPADAFLPDGPDPRVTDTELAAFRAVRDAVAEPAPVATSDAANVAQLVGWPLPEREGTLVRIGRAIAAFDPKEGGSFPERAALFRPERVLHVHLGTDADPQAGLVRALKAFGTYSQINWLQLSPTDRHISILEEAERIRPTLVFMQLQTAGALDVETIARLREVADSSCVIATWCGDVGSENSPWGADGKSNLDWQVAFERACDLTLHSSYSHVRILRAAGIHSAAYLQIGYDEEQYRPAIHAVDCDLDEDCSCGAYAPKDYYVSFLGSRYAGGDAFSRSMKYHDGDLRDAIIAGMHDTFENKLGLFGRGWASLIDGFEEKVIALPQAHTVYQRSHIGLNVSLANYLEAYSSDRIFRILGSGATLLTMRFPMIETFGLRHGENCLIFDDEEAAVSMASSYMACALSEGGEINGLPPNAIADAGARLAIENHTWDVRMRELLPLVDAVRAARRGA